ncbi:MAG: helix-turn-helix transcriptional regulator [Bacteroidota bacterium]
MPDESRVFSALLRYWRTRRGLSQLDLALAADISARHISFLETGRSRPSEGMVLLLAATLDVPLRERNVMLREAGYAPAFDEPGLGSLSEGVRHALSVLLRQHEPYPMMILDRGYDVLDMNGPGRALATLMGAEGATRWNAVRALFDPAGARRYLTNWESVAREFVARLQRESLRAPHNDRLRQLLDEILDRPDVPDDWRTPDLALGAEGALTLHVDLGGTTLAFVTTMMGFHAPQNVTLDEVQVESYVPLDEATAEACARLFT